MWFQAAKDCRLFYQPTGLDTSRPVVIFLNGTAQTTLSWVLTVRRQNEVFATLLYDARCQGYSDIGSEPITLDRHIQDLCGLMNFLDIPTAHLVGLSHGAHVALGLTDRHPKRVNSLILCSIGANNRAKIQTRISNWISLLSRQGLKGFARHITADVLGPDYLDQNADLLDQMHHALVKRNRKEALLTHLNAMRKYPPAEQLAASVSHPCLVLSGENDRLIPPAAAASLAAHCRGRHQLIAGAGHSLPIEAPELFDKAILNFLQSL